jgi:hypothetical protein
MLLVIAGFTGWHLYMKATWDHHLVGETYLISKPFYLKEDEIVKRHYLSENEFMGLVQKYNIPLHDVVVRNMPYKVFKVEIIKNGSHYYWVSNGNKKLTKRLEHDGHWDVYIYETEDKSEFIKVLGNSFEIGGCAARPYYYRWSMETQQILDEKTTLMGGFLVNFYQNPIQYFLCYETTKTPEHTMLTRLFY